MPITTVPDREPDEDRTHQGFAEALSTHPTTAVPPGDMALSVVVAVWVEKLGQQVELKRTTVEPKLKRLPWRKRL